MTTAVPQLTPEHRSFLESSAIAPAVIEASGIISGPEGILFPWSGPGGPEPVFQLRPDAPSMDADGRVVKYIQPKGVRLPFNRLRDDGPDSPVLIVEGTKQQWAVLSWAPAQYAVYGISGARTWSGLDLSWVEGRDVRILFDGDLATNRDVHDAAVALRDELEMEGAESVGFVFTPAKGKDGVDDVLARLDPDRRRASLSRWLANPKSSPGKPPARKAANRFMGKDGLMVRALAEDILDKQPAALTAEGRVALYANGVFTSGAAGQGGLAILEAVESRLMDQHRSTHLTSAEQAVKAALYRAGRILPETVDAPLVNFTNGMLDLRTGVLSAHDPAYLSRTQHPVPYDPAAACPVYEAWLREVIPDQADALEEIAGSMFDPSRTPAKVLFAFGPSHSGKSTFIRLLLALAGPGNSSAVTLHQLSEDRFAAANVYGMALNAASDLSSRDVNDLSAFKMMTGEDPVQANRKYGQQFTFTSRALFAFSANDLPAVSEASRAYINRVAPFHFNRSFEGREDPDLEAKLREELPGIARRWTWAYAAYLARGAHLQVAGGVQQMFERRSDRVQDWVAAQLRVHEVGHSELPWVGEDQGTPGVELYARFKLWAEQQGGKPLGRNKLYDRLTSVNGVQKVRVGQRRQQGFNITLKPESEQE